MIKEAISLSIVLDWKDLNFPKVNSEVKFKIVNQKAF